ncbi:MAG: hypothetical protein ACYTFG_15125, partial [Planctomycetota bacterium]
MARIFDLKNLKISQKLGITLLIVAFCAGVLPNLAVFLTLSFITENRTTIAFVMVGSILAGFGLAWLVAIFWVRGAFVTTLGALSDWTKMVHMGNYVPPPGLEQQDEIGTLSREFKEVYENLVAELEHSTVLISNLKQTVEKINEYSAEILSISNEQATGANEQATAVQEASTTSKEIAVTAKEIT